MPDPAGQTISASQAAALWNKSPYLTRWMLWQHFAKGMSLDKEGDARMSWGLKLEPLIIAEAAADLKLEVRPNQPQAYVSRGRFGCTRDAEIIAPDLGPGALECKCVFDFRTWMQDWDGGKRVPAHYEIQLQTQLYVGDGREPYRWGAFAVWVAGEVHYFRREPAEGLWADMEREAEAFFAAVEACEEPDPFGASVELPFLTNLPRRGDVIDLSEEANAKEIAEAARMFDAESARARGVGRSRDHFKAQLLAALGEASEAILYGGIRVKVRQDDVPEHTRAASKRTILKVTVPAELPDDLLTE